MCFRNCLYENLCPVKRIKRPSAGAPHIQSIQLLSSEKLCIHDDRKEEEQNYKSDRELDQEALCGTSLVLAPISILGSLQRAESLGFALLHKNDGCQSYADNNNKYG